MQTLKAFRRKIPFLLSLGAAVLLSACGEPEAPIEDYQTVDGAPDDVNLEQGWGPDSQDEAWFTSFGSRLIPYDWLKHLELPNSTERFRSDEHMRSLGFLIQEQPTKHNPDRLPVGITIAQDSKGVDWAGLGCSACHTGEIHYQGSRIRIDGGAGMLNFTEFEGALIKSLSATLADSEKFDRFASAVNDTSQTALELKNQVIELTESLNTRHRINHTDVPYGFGRLDAFGQIFNSVAVQFIGIGENRRPPDAPVSFPFIWGAPHLDVVQWNGSAPNDNGGPLFQNATTAIAVYGNVMLQGHDGKAGYPSTVEFDNLARIGELAYQLKPPKWPEKIFGTLNQDQVQRGRKLYIQECQSCHLLSDRDQKDRKLEAKLTPLDQIGTDPRMVNNFLNATAKSGELQGRKVAIFAGDEITEEMPTIDLVAHVALGTVLRHPIEAIRTAVKDYHSVYKAALDKHPDYYKARPLAGIWATAPFLHNGSVSSLHELLLPPDQRLKQFYVGSFQFDPEKVGFITGQSEHSSLYDTTLLGNANSGHEYGIDLAVDQKTDLIEYLKSL